MTNTSKVLKVAISNPSELIWKGEAESVSSENSAGKFDILFGHANFVTMINDKPIIIRNRDSKNQVVTYKTAVISVMDSHVIIYADI